MKQDANGAARRRGNNTSTAEFGSSRREGHDASAFYERFVAPEISTDDDIQPAMTVDEIIVGDSRDMTAVAANSVALVVTSPPYFAGKQYEAELGVNGVPGDYFEYLDLLGGVFAECKRVLEPGGRIAVNVANLGRRPYRSLAADVTDVLQDLGLLLRGEVVWWKGRAAGGSCAWGTFQRPTNPVLRDMTERVVIASKGRFDRAIPPAKRAAAGLPSTSTISRDEFLEATTDLWEFMPESATRIGHPAPFPVELPQRLIHLYTYADDTVLDPFMGSGTTAVAAVRTGRHYVGYDTDSAYVEAARARIERERSLLATGVPSESGEMRVHLSPRAVTEPDGDSAGLIEAPWIRDGRQARDIAAELLRACGFEDIREDVKPAGLGITLGFVAADRHGHPWAFDVSGAFTTGRAGLRRADTLWKALAKASVLHESDLGPQRLILLTTDAPKRRSAGAQALAAVRGEDRPVFDVIELLNPVDQTRLRSYAHGNPIESDAGR